MPATWKCLYLHSDDANGVVQQLQESLVNLGYTLFNPFGLIPGKAYTRSIRLFVAPASGGWVKIIGSPDQAQYPYLSQHTALVYAALQGADAEIGVYMQGEAANPEAALSPFLRPDRTPHDLQQALRTTSNVIPLEGSDSGLPFNALPEDIQTLAGQVNTGQAQKMFARLSGDLLKKVSGDKQQAEAARALISHSDTPDWNSGGGLRIRAVMACLTVPETWREPDFDSLRDAYPLFERRRRNPNARVYPGDEAVMAKVPDALDYTPVYGGAN